MSDASVLVVLGLAAMPEIASERDFAGEVRVRLFSSQEGGVLFNVFIPMDQERAECMAEAWASIASEIREMGT